MCKFILQIEFHASQYDESSLLTQRCASGSRTKGRTRELPKSTSRNITRESEEGILFDENTPLLGHNSSVIGLVPKDGRVWIRWPLAFLRFFVVAPVAIIASPVRRYDEAHPGQLAAVFAIVSLVVVFTMYLTVFADVPSAR